MFIRMMFVLVLSLSAVYAKLPQKVIICGVCRDVERFVPRSIGYMRKIASHFEDARFIIYENNSKDSTRKIIKRWNRKDARVNFIYEDVPQEKLDLLIKNRVDGKHFVAEKIARARNIVLDVAMSDEYANYEYIIWMDMDFFREPSYEGIVEVFESDQEWDAVFAYGIDPPGTFWDWYAYRDADNFLGSEHLGMYWWRKPKTLKMTTNDPWKPVLSGFGGCGIYRKSSIGGCRYSGLVTNDLARYTKLMIDKYPNHPEVQRYHRAVSRMSDIKTLKSPNQAQLSNIRDPRKGFVLESDPHKVVWVMSSFAYRYPSVCEHVAFHASMIVNGHDKLFINPRMVFRY